MTVRPQATTLMHDVAAAFGLLTRLPVRVDVARASDRGAAGAWAYPLVGAAVGMACAGVATVVSMLGLPPMAAGLCAVAAGAMLTGALHEDGLADCADGIWGGWTPERRLEIMKDSRIGAYGVIALVFTLSLRAVLIAALVETGAVVAGLVATGAASRAAMVGVWAALPPARRDGLARSIGRPDRGVGIAACVMAGLFAAASLPIYQLGLLCVACALAAVSVARLARARLGGQTGDVLGATQQVAEIATLCVIVGAAAS